MNAYQPPAMPGQCESVGPLGLRCTRSEHPTDYHHEAATRDSFVTHRHAEWDDDRADLPCTVCGRRAADHPTDGAGLAIAGAAWRCGMTPALIIAIRHTFPDDTDCETCGGTQEVPHPAYGTAACPTPTIRCPEC